jgi:hypothetical protein
LNAIIIPVNPNDPKKRRLKESGHLWTNFELHFRYL